MCNTTSTSCITIISNINRQPSPGCDDEDRASAVDDSNNRNNNMFDLHHHRDCSNNNSGKKRRLSRVSTATSSSRSQRRRRRRRRVVQFGMHHNRTFLVEKFSTVYNKGHLWYDRDELQRLHRMELCRNLQYPDLVDHGYQYQKNDIPGHDRADEKAAIGGGVFDDLTWRGLEDFKPRSGSSNSSNDDSKSTRKANAKSHARVIVRECVDQRGQRGGYWNPNDLAYLSYVLSNEDTKVARTRALEDAAAAAAIHNNHHDNCSSGSGSSDGQAVNKNGMVVPRNHQIMSSSSGSSSSIIESSVVVGFLLRWGLHPSMEGTVTWMFRVILFCIYCGLLFPH